jgi:cytochrome P450
VLQIDPPHMHLQLESWCDRLGPIYRLKLGSRVVVVLGDHEAIAAVLRDRPEGFRRTSRLEEIGEELGLLPGVFGVNGAVWRRQRRMVMASFSPGHIRRYYPSLVEVAQRLSRRWKRAAQQGASIDLQADLMRYTVDAISGLAFGADVNTLESEGDVIQQHLDKIFPALHKRLIAPLPVWRWIRTPADRAVERGVVAVMAAVEKFVCEARARLKADPGLRQRPNNLLEAMLAAADEDGSGIDDRQVAGNVFTMLLAGEDTTANTLAWMIHLLWCDPAALARATREVRGVIGNAHAPTLEQLEALDFLEACAQETMRLKPVAPLIGIEAVRDTVIADVKIPAGTVLINAMRWDGIKNDQISNAAQFVPERWLGESTQGAPLKRLSMPFGAGPRICPGRYLALLEMKLAIATLLCRFDIESIETPDGAPPRERLTFTMAPVGLRMRVKESVRFDQ